MHQPPTLFIFEICGEGFVDFQSFKSRLKTFAEVPTLFGIRGSKPKGHKCREFPGKNLL